MRENFKPGTMIYPLPAVMVSCGTKEEDFNIITIAWIGTLCSNPPMCYISVRPERHSYPIIKAAGEFVINLTTSKMVKQTDWCGVKSGKDFNKFKELGLTPIKSKLLQTPSIKESPLSIECKIKDIIELGSHHAFIAEVVNVSADKQYLDTKTGKFELEKAGLAVYSHGAYYETGKYLGHFGFSVKKKK